MRSLLLVLLLPCFACRPAGSPAGGSDAVGTTHIDGPDLTLDLPGHWTDVTDDTGHDLSSDRQEMFLQLFEKPDWMDPDVAATRLAVLHRRFMTRLPCRRGAVLSAPTPWAARPGGERFYFVCDDPRGVITNVALTVEPEVLWYAHVWAGERGYSPALDRADDAILESLHVRPVASVCPGATLGQLRAGGICLEAAVLGQAGVNLCTRALVIRGWIRDSAAAEAMASATAKSVVCYRRRPAVANPAPGEQSL